MNVLISASEKKNKKKRKKSTNRILITKHISLNVIPILFRFNTILQRIYTSQKYVYVFEVKVTICG